MDTITSLNSNMNTAVLSSAYPTAQVGAAVTGLKGALETQQMIQANLAAMMQDITPHLGQNIDVMA
jgi:hypothetical protein